METKNYGLTTRQQELEYVSKITSRTTPDGETSHKRYESLARDLKFMKAIVGFWNCSIKDSLIECYSSLMSAIETQYELSHIDNDFFNCMMNELYNITLLAMNDEQYQCVLKLVDFI